jgi:hypothetical protein
LEKQVKNQKYKGIIWLLAGILLYNIEGCFILKKMTGSDIDPVQFQKAREAKMLEVKSQALTQLTNRLQQNNPIENSDITIYINQELLNKIAQQYVSATGWLDEATSYEIKSVNLILNSGSAIASLGLNAYNKTHNVRVDMTLDCIMTFEIVNNELTTKLEPFNISPSVTAGGILASADEIISNLIKINLANLNKNFPPLKIPINFANNVIISENKTDIRDKVNLSINSPKRSINYNFKIKEVLVFEGRLFISLNIENIEVK